MSVRVPGGEAVSGRPGSGVVASPAGDMAAVLATARQIAEAVPDPELPMLTLADLGILREIRADGQRVIVSLTPTYTGCPALQQMQLDLSGLLAAAGLDAEVRTVLRPAWSSDWISAAGRRKLAAAGIAPPGAAVRRGPGPIPITLTATPPDVACPRCGASGARQTAAFSGTACKALYRCAGCDEPFEHFKEI